MSIKLITPCVGRKECCVFKSAQDLVETLETPKTFKNLMMAMEVVKSWRKKTECPFKIQESDINDGEEFHVAICSIASKPPFSMDAVSRGTGYSKTRVAQIEYTAFRKLKQSLGTSTLESEIVLKA